MTMDAFFTVALQVIGALERLGVSYEVGGSIASSLHGVFRATADVDIVADLPAQSVAAFVEALGPEFYADADAIRAAVRAKRSFNIIHTGQGIKIDVFALKNTAFARTEFARRMQLPFPPPAGPLVWVSSPEDIILHKLLWYQSGSYIAQRQLEDAVNVLKSHAGRLDDAYLVRWAEALSVSDLLKKAQAAAITRA